MRVVQDDYGYDLNFTITDSSGSALDLTDGTITFKMALNDATSSTVSGTCSPTVAASGTCYYTVQDGDMDTVGIYDWEVQVVYDTKTVTAKGTEQIEVIPQMPWGE